MCLHECIHEILCHRRWHRIAFLQVTNDKKQNCVSSQAFANQRLRYYEIFQKGGSEAALVFLFDDRAEQAWKNTEAAATKVVVVTASVSNPTSPSTVDPRVAAAVAIAGAASASKVPRKRTVQSHSGGVLQEEPRSVKNGTHSSTMKFFGHCCSTQIMLLTSNQTLSPVCLFLSFSSPLPGLGGSPRISQFCSFRLSFFCSLCLNTPTSPFQPPTLGVKSW